jgi:ABC-type lipoprotein release transport system permease subunit
MRRFIYLAELALKNAARRSGSLGGVAAVFALAVALASVADGAFEGAARNASLAFRLRAGGSVSIQGLERRKTGGLIELSSERELSPFLARLPAGSVLRKRCDFQARMHAGASTAAARVHGLDIAAEAGFLSSLGPGVHEALSVSAGRGLVINAKAAGALGLKRGEEVLLETKDVLGRVTADAYSVAAIVEEPPLLEEGSVYMELAAANRLRGYGPGQFGRLAISLPESTEAATCYGLLSSSAPALPWKRGLVPNSRPGDTAALVRGLGWSGRAYLFTTEAETLVYPLRLLEALRAGGRLLFILLLAVAALGAASSYGMIALGREAEIGSLRAIGLTRGDVAALYSLEALFVGLVSSLSGLLLGWALLGAAALLPFPVSGAAAVFFRAGRLAPVIRPAPDLAAIAACSLSALLGARFPARRASRLSPARAFGGASRS